MYRSLLDIMIFFCDKSIDAYIQAVNGNYESAG